MVLSALMSDSTRRANSAKYLLASMAKLGGGAVIKISEAISLSDLQFDKMCERSRYRDIGIQYLLACLLENSTVQGIFHAYMSLVLCSGNFDNCDATSVVLVLLLLNALLEDKKCWCCRSPTGEGYGLLAKHVFISAEQLSQTSSRAFLLYLGKFSLAKSYLDADRMTPVYLWQLSTYHLIPEVGVL